MVFGVGSPFTGVADKQGSTAAELTETFRFGGSASAGSDLAPRLFCGIVNNEWVCLHQEMPTLQAHLSKSNEIQIG